MAIDKKPRSKGGYFMALTKSNYEGDQKLHKEIMNHEMVVYTFITSLYNNVYKDCIRYLITHDESYQGERVSYPSHALTKHARMNACFKVLDILDAMEREYKNVAVNS